MHTHTRTHTCMRMHTRVFFFPQKQTESIPPFHSEFIASSQQQSTSSLVVTKDDRTASLGIKKIYLGSLQNSNSNSTTCTNQNQYTIFRYMNGIGEGTEIANRIPLECNLDLLRYISFTKGCYIGQELIARTKYKVHVSFFKTDIHLKTCNSFYTTFLVLSVNVGCCTETNSPILGGPASR